MTYADLFISLNGTVRAPAKDAQHATVGLFWSNREPSMLSISVRTGPDDHQTWEVARATFAGAVMPQVRGAWVGGGDFAVLCGPAGMMLKFRPHNRPRDLAFLALPGEPVAKFIAHTYRLLPASAEDAINIEAVDKALERILRDA